LEERLLLRHARVPDRDDALARQRHRRTRVLRSLAVGRLSRRRAPGDRPGVHAAAVRAPREEARDGARARAGAATPEDGNGAARRTRDDLRHRSLTVVPRARGSDRLRRRRPGRKLARPPSRPRRPVGEGGFHRPAIRGRPDEPASPRAQAGERAQDATAGRAVNPSLELGRIAGIRIGVNWSWLVAFALIAWTLASSVFPSDYPHLS